VEQDLGGAGLALRLIETTGTPDCSIRLHDAIDRLAGDARDLGQKSSPGIQRETAQVDCTPFRNSSCPS
jgi:hypothetical protein